MKRFFGLLSKDLKVALRNYYLLIVVVTAVILIALTNFVIPEKLSMDLKLIYTLQSTDTAEALLPLERFLEMSPGTVKVASREELVQNLEEDRNSIGMVLQHKAGQPVIEMVLQGHESYQTKQSLKIMIRPILEAGQVDQRAVETRILRSSTAKAVPFNLAMIPLMILLEPVMLGFILVAALIFMEKDEETTKAFLVSPGRMFEYLASKIVVMFLLGLLSTILITSFTVGLDINWGLLISLVGVGSIFGSALGLFIGSLFDSISKAMIWILGLSFFLSAPQVSYFVPSFAPKYLTWMPTYSMLFALKEAIFPTGNLDVIYSALISTGALGLLLYLLSIVTFKRTLGRD